MYTLGIESSCDETAAAILKNEKVLSSCIFSQIDLHAKFGGVIPEIAAREHLAKIGPIVDESFRQANIGFDQLDLIAVSNGPGLIGSLLVGVSYAKGLSLRLNKTLIPVNHVHAHVHSLFLNNQSVDFPALILVVSGGHTHLYRLKSPIEFELLGFSQDDACGEAYDKVAKMLGLTYPGGPVIDKLAINGDADRFPMPKVSVKNFEFGFSFSGIKTHLYRLINQLKQSNLLKDQIADVCAAFQKVAIEQLIERLRQACAKYPDTKTIGISGGVAANSLLREKLAEFDKSLHFLKPEMKYCADNAAMIAHLGWKLHHQKQKDEWDVFARYPYE